MTSGQVWSISAVYAIVLAVVALLDIVYNRKQIFRKKKILLTKEPTVLLNTFLLCILFTLIISALEKEGDFQENRYLLVVSLISLLIVKFM